MKRIYCTLFNMYYAAKAVAMMDSLKKHSSSEILMYALAMDDDTFIFLTKLMKDRPWVIPLHRREITSHWRENKIRQRTIEYQCFSYTSLLLSRVMRRVGQPEVTYLDADMFFFSDPETAFREIGEKEVAIVPHRFPEHDRARLEPNGIFNVSWVTFRDTWQANYVLEKWASQCITKCDAESVGDQKYLDQWPDFLKEKLHIFDGASVGLGPWTAYTDEIGPGPSVNGKPLIVYHFHAHHRNGVTDTTERGRTGGYPVTAAQAAYIYEPYEKQLSDTQRYLESL